MSQELRLSTIINSLTGNIPTTGTGGSTETTVVSPLQIEIGTVTLGTTPSVSLTKQGGVNKLNFVLAAPIDSLSQLSAVVEQTAHHHVIDTITMNTAPLTEFALAEKPNSCPIIIIFNGKTYAEVSGAEQPFKVERTGDTATIKWYSSRAGVTLSSSVAEKLYIHYEVSTTILHVRENIDITQISTNSFFIADTPNETMAAIIINGVVYFEDKEDFTINRTTRKVTWSASKTGFSINSNSLSGYLTVCYDKTIS